MSDRERRGAHKVSVATKMPPTVDAMARFPTEDLANLTFPRPYGPGGEDLTREGRYLDGYGTIDWGRTVDCVVTGSVTPTAGATVLVPLTASIPLIIAPPSRVNGAMGVLVVRQFFLAPRASTGVGTLGVQYQSPSGDLVALGMAYLAAGWPIEMADVRLLTQGLLFAAPVQAVGSLLFALSAGGTAVVCDFALGLGVAYLKPATSIKVDSEEEE